MQVCLNKRRGEKKRERKIGSEKQKQRKEKKILHLLVEFENRICQNKRSNIIQNIKNHLLSTEEQAKLPSPITSNNNKKTGEKKKEKENKVPTSSQK